jgi:hypothetical protein
MYSSRYYRLLLPLLTIICLQSIAQSGNANAQLKTILDSKKFRFHATSATSQRGKTVQLTSEYFLKLNGDGLSVDLPYYGRSYSSDYGSTDLSIQFNTNQFTYDIDSTKKGGWNISIVPKNQPRASKIYLSITTSGYCTTQVTSNSRTAVSFYGSITAYDAR